MYRVRCRNLVVNISDLMLPLVIVFFYSNYLGEYLKMYFYILLHELAHGIVAMLYGRRIQELRITPGGVNLEIDRKSSSERFDKRKKEILMFLAGPALNLVLGCIFHFMQYEMAARANLVLAAFNLLPIKPLDGYSILSTLIGEKKREGKVFKFCSKVLSGFTLAILIAIVINGFRLGEGSVISLISCLFILSIGSNSIDKKVNLVKNVLTTDANFKKEGFYRGDIISVLYSCEVRKIMTKLGNNSARIPGRKKFRYVYVLDDGLSLMGILTEKDIVNAIVNNNGDKTFNEILQFKKSEKNKASLRRPLC